MFVTYETTFACTLYNDMSNKTSQPKQLRLKVTFPTNAKQPLSTLSEPVVRLTAALHKAHVIGVDNTDLIRLLEPEKIGATVHNFLHKLKSQVGGRGVSLLGQTVPSETVNGDKVLVLGPDWQVSLEGLALYVLAGIPNVDQVELSDGTYAVTVLQSDNTLGAML